MENTKGPYVLKMDKSASTISIGIHLMRDGRLTKAFIHSLEVEKIKYRIGSTDYLGRPEYSINPSSHGHLDFPFSINLPSLLMFVGRYPLAS